MEWEGFEISSRGDGGMEVCAGPRSKRTWLDRMKKQLSTYKESVEDLQITYYLVVTGKSIIKQKKAMTYMVTH